MNYNIKPTDGIKRIVGIYHADGGIIGEIKYFAGKIFGGSHCSLCDITHTSRGKDEVWKKCEANIGIPIDLVHLNERDNELKKYTDGITPCIVGKTGTNYILLVSKEQLDMCEGKPEKLEKLITEKLIA